MTIIRDTNESTPAEVNRAAEVLHETVEQTEGAAQQTVGAAGRAGEAGVKAVANGIQASADQLPRTFAKAGSVFAGGLQDISREYVSLMQDGLQKNLEGLSTLMGSQSAADLFLAQRQLVRDNMERTVEGNRRLAEISVRLVNDTARILQR